MLEKIDVFALFIQTNKFPSYCIIMINQSKGRFSWYLHANKSTDRLYRTTVFCYAIIGKIFNICVNCNVYNKRYSLRNRLTFKTVNYY